MFWSHINSTTATLLLWTGGKKEICPTRREKLGQKHAPHRMEKGMCSQKLETRPPKEGDLFTLEEGERKRAWFEYPLKSCPLAFLFRVKGKSASSYFKAAKEPPPLLSAMPTVHVWRQAEPAWQSEPVCRSFNGIQWSTKSESAKIPTHWKNRANDFDFSCDIWLAAPEEQFLFSQPLLCTPLQKRTQVWFELLSKIPLAHELLSKMLPENEKN